MRTFLFILFTFVLFSVVGYSQPAAGINIADIKKKVESSDQKKNVLVSYDAKSDRSTITTTRIILGRQMITQDNAGETQSFGSNIPSWEITVHTAFAGQVLGQPSGEFAWRFNIYNPRFQPDTELVVKVDGEEMRYKPSRSGRAAVSNVSNVATLAQLDKTENTIQQNTGSVADAARPFYSIFVLTRADIDKILHAKNVKVSLGKQYDVGLVKDLKSSLDVMLSVTDVK